MNRHRLKAWPKFLTRRPGRRHGTKPDRRMEGGGLTKEAEAHWKAAHQARLEVHSFPKAAHASNA